LRTIKANEILGLAENTGLRSPQICCPVFSLLDPRSIRLAI